MSSIGVSRVIHINANCTDLERSLGFYRDLLGLEPGAHTVPEPQEGAAFGLERAQWDAWILNDARGFGAGIALDLLEWQVPRPEGAPYPAANHLGFGRLGFTHPDIAGLYDRLVAAGVECTGAPHDVALEGTPPMQAFICTDPDGIFVEFVTGRPDQAGSQLSFVAVNCSDLDRSLEFYVDVMGMEVEDQAPGFVQFGNKGAGANFALGRLEDSPTRSAEPELWWFVESAQAAYDELKGKGVEIATPVTQMPFGKTFSIKDPAGQQRYLLELAAPVK